MDRYIEILEQQLENSYEETGEILGSGITISTPTKPTPYCRRALQLARLLNSKVNYCVLNRVTDWDWGNTVIDMLRGSSVKEIIEPLTGLIARADEATHIALADSEIGHIDWINASLIDLRTTRITLTKNSL